jgi:hypothetical protein
MRELGYRKVGRQAGLFPFFPNYSHPNISNLNHADIVPAISNTTDSLSRNTFDEFCDFGFLGRGTAAHSGTR